jgi:hypothetical protein
MGDVRREFRQRLSVLLHGTLGSYLCGAMHEDCADDAARFPAPRAEAFCFHSPYCWYFTLFSFVFS